MQVFGSTNAATLPKAATSKATTSFLDSTNLKVFLLVVGTLLVTASLSVWQMNVAGAGNWISITTGCVGGLLVLAVALKTLHTYIQNRNTSPSPSKTASHAKSTSSPNQPNPKSQAINPRMSVKQIIEDMRTKGLNCSSRAQNGRSIIENATRAKNEPLLKALLQNFPIIPLDIGVCIDIAIDLDTDMENKCAILACLEDAHLLGMNPTVDVKVQSIPKKLVGQAMEALDLQALTTIFESFELDAQETQEALVTAGRMENPAKDQFISALRKAGLVAYKERIAEDDEPQEVIAFIDLLGLNSKKSCERAIRHGAFETLKAIISIKKIDVTGELIAYAEAYASEKDLERTALKPEIISYLQGQKRAKT